MQTQLGAFLPSFADLVWMISGSLSHQAVTFIAVLACCTSQQGATVLASCQDLGRCWEGRASMVLRGGLVLGACWL